MRGYGVLKLTKRLFGVLLGSRDGMEGVVERHLDLVYIFYNLYHGHFTGLQLQVFENRKGLQNLTLYSSKKVQKVCERHGPVRVLRPSLISLD
jgi:hypothetical protein